MKHTSLTDAFWDYPLSETILQQKLATGTKKEKTWITERILEHMPYEEIWRYITLVDLQAVFADLHLRPQLRQKWAYTLTLWQKHEENTH